MASLRERMLQDMRIRNLSDNTQKTYILQVSLFARYFKQSPERLGPQQIRQYGIYMVEEKGLGRLIGTERSCGVAVPVQEYAASPVVS